MPIINISMVEGRSAEQKEAMGQAITRVVQETIGAPLDTIKIVINEIPPELWFSNGVSIQSRHESEKSG
ncbi:MAG: tautomerase family protein [Gammaproteobacteria bacterium]|nr:tautomerase family protein [Gammaproteobacteria bacterium]